MGKIVIVAAVGLIVLGGVTALNGMKQPVKHTEPPPPPPAAKNFKTTSAPTSQTRTANPKILAVVNRRKDAKTLNAVAAVRDRYKGSLRVQWIDTMQFDIALQAHKFTKSPGLIFMDGHDRELARHEGDMTVDEIIAQCKALKFDLKEPAPQSRPSHRTGHRTHRRHR